MEEKNLSNLTLDDLVFENRNKSYGSYELRVNYGVYVMRAFAISIVLFLLIAYSPKISTLLESWFGQEKELVEPEVEVIAELKDIPIEKDIPPPPPMKVEPPKIETVKFLPPEIKPDKEVKKEELPPPVDKIDSAAISTKDQKGEKLGEILEDVAGSEIGTGEDTKIYTYVGEWPEFPGGAAERNKFLVKHLVYPRDAERKGIEGRVIIGFTVEKTGEIVDVKILKGVLTSMDQEAERVVKMMPKWKPGKNNGVPVRTRHKVDVVYKLPE